MTSNDTIAALGAFGTCASAILGGLAWLWRVAQTASEAMTGVREIKAEWERDKVIYDARLQRAEDAAESMRDLAGAVKHMGEMTALEIKNLAEKVVEHSTFAKEQFGEIRHTLKNQDTKVQQLAQQVSRLN